VTIIHRRKELRASKIMQDRAFKNSKIRFLWDTVVTGVDGDVKVVGLHLRHTVTKEESYLTAGGLFVAIGHAPNTAIFDGQLDMDESGYIITAGGSTATNVEGVFASGDVQDRTYRQAITAAASGCMAAIDAERWLAANHGTAS
jgi:thioredoxin reductase (NADPH)